MEETKKVYGIDLGTTYSCIAHMDEYGKPVVLKNGNGNNITASVVFFEEDGDKTNIVVGDAAKESGQLYPNDVVSFVKRQMGTDYEFWNKDQKYRAEEISALILRKLVKDAEESIGEVIENVVITVPAYFGINEREATKRAGEIAGLNVIDIINEPTAAAIAYGISREISKRVLVYDLGGGTFDVTLIDITPDSIEVVVTGGDHNLGGKNWDDEIIAYLADQYAQQTGKDDDILDDPETAKELEVKAEASKKTISDNKKTAIAYAHNGDKIRVELTREKFEELTEHLLARTIELTKLMLEEARKKGEGNIHFDEIILVGGSTRMPQIEASIIREFNVQPIKFEPDESVAKGAAIYGMEKSIRDWVVAKKEELISESGKANVQQITSAEANEIHREAEITFGVTSAKLKEITETKIINVTSKSFGIIVISDVDGQEVERVVNLIKKNDSLPIEISQTFGTHYEKQDNVLFEIMENEFSDDLLQRHEAIKIGEALMELPAGLRKGSPLEVTFKLDESGRLDMKGLEITDNRIVRATIITTSVITEEQVVEAKEKSKMLVVL